MAKAGVETDVSQQFRSTGVETGQQFLSLTPKPRLAGPRFQAFARGRLLRTS